MGLPLTMVVVGHHFVAVIMHFRDLRCGIPIWSLATMYVLLQTAYDLSGQDPVFDEEVMPPVAVANDDQ